MAPTPIPITNPWKGKEPEQPPPNHKDGTPEVHFGMKVLMTETLVTLSQLQLEFHLTMEQLQTQEALSDQDYSLEVNLTHQAMSKLA